MLRYWQELLILILAFIFTSIVTSILLALIGADYYNSVATNSYLQSALVSQIVMFFGAGVLFFIITKLPLSHYLTISLFRRSDWLLFALFFGIAMLSTFSLSPLMGWIAEHYANHPWVLHQAEVTAIQNKVIGSLRGGKIWIALAVFAVLPALAEEFIFRGILYPILKNITRRKQLSMWLTALVFAALHFQVLSFLPILVVGYLLAAAYEKTNNLLVAILMHFCFNGVQILFWQA